MHDNGVARLNTGRESIVPVTADRCRIVGRKQSVKGWLDSRTTESNGVDVVYMTTLGRLRFLSRADCYFVLAHTGNTVRIGQAKTAVVFGVWFQVEDTSRKHVRGHVRKCHCVGSHDPLGGGIVIE